LVGVGPGGEAAGSRGTFVRTPSRADPDERARTLLEQGRTHAGAGDNLAAAQAYRRALELDPQLHEARIQYARLLAASGRERRARQVLRTGLDEAPAHRRMARYYAALADETGEVEAAIDALEPAARLEEPGALEAHLAALYRGAERYAAAARVYRALAEAEPGNGLWLAGLALTAEGQGDREAALQAWRRVLEQGVERDAVAAHARRRVEALSGE
ncbi:tetratricopeptide repeat protein, partial [Halorhodospira neutriphila]